MVSKLAKSSLLVVLVVLAIACAASYGLVPPNKKGCPRPVYFQVDNQNWSDVTIREAATGARLGTVGGLQQRDFEVCQWHEQPAAVVLDLLGGRGYYLEGSGTIYSESTVRIVVGSKVNISFISVLAP